MNMHSLLLEKNKSSFLENIIQYKLWAQEAPEVQGILTSILAKSLSLGKKIFIFTFKKKKGKEKTKQKQKQELHSYSKIGVMGRGKIPGNNNGPFLSGDNRLVNV